MCKLLTTIFAMITIGATAQEVIMDVHSHIIPPPYLAYLERHDALLDEGVPLPQWNVGDQLKWMDETGVQTSVLTLAAPHPYFGDAAENARLIRQTNEAAAKLKAAYPDRFKFCAALPLPDVNAAIEETTYALDVLKADGIKLATNACGQYLGAPELDTLFSVLHQRNAIVILHPHKPAPVNREVMCQTPLAMQEYLSETTRAVSNLISRNVPARYPNIRIAVPHCGAYLPLAVPRMKSLAPVMRQNGMIGETDWEKNLAALYYDLAGARSPETVRMLLTITTPDRLLYGSDYPYVAPQLLTSSLARMKQYLADEPDLAPFRKMILEYNARWLFGDLPEKPTAETNKNKTVVRIAEIEVYPEYLTAYLEAAREIERLSLTEEKGVICLFPNRMKEDGTQIRILEIYASEEAYQHHIRTPHFLNYKQGTMKMVKSLKLNDLQPSTRNRCEEFLRRCGKKGNGLNLLRQIA